MAQVPQPLQQALEGRYRIERELGHGGMATVFLAEDLKHHRRVAIKVLDPEVAAAIGSERFAREIDTVARLAHPHILPLFDSGDAGGLLYYVMPFVEGGSLRQRLVREKQLPVDDALRIAGEVADALHEAHRHGIVHRDIKPENVLLEARHAVVADFGIARAIAAGAPALTASGVTVGTPAYMSPEQAAGRHDLDGRSDEYSLACLLFEMLAGAPPFAAPTAENLIYQHLNVAPRAVTELRPSVPPPVARALTKALAKTPADRYATVAEFRAELVMPMTSSGSRAPEAHRVSEDSETLEMAVIPAAGVPRTGAARGLRGRCLIAALVVLAAAASPFVARWAGHRDRAASPARHWILVAEFDGPAGDTTLAAAARSLVSAALDQSRLLAVVPRDQVQLALQQAGKPPGTHVTGEVARELAYRRSVRAVLEGEVERIGSGYSVVLRVVDAESLRVIQTVQGSARSEDELIPALGKLANRLRRELGERAAAVAATRPLTVAVTPSFEAYRLYARGLQLMRSNEPISLRAALSLARAALALDPDFAGAWNLLATTYTNLREPDSALAAHREALRRPQRMSDAMRLMVQAGVAMGEGELEGALDEYDRLLAIAPGNVAALHNRSVVLQGLGRTEEALESVRQAGRQAPFGPGIVNIGNEVEYLCELGRTDEARAIARALPGLNGRFKYLYVEAAACKWAAAESLASEAMGDAGFADTRVPVLLASSYAGRGQLRRAAGAYERADSIAARSSSPDFEASRARIARLMLTRVTAGGIPVPARDWSGDATAATMLARGLRAALTGDLPLAGRLLSAVRARPQADRVQQGATPVLLESWIEADRGRHDRVLATLGPGASQPAEIPASYTVGTASLRWTLAEAYVASGRPDSAALWLEQVVSDCARMDESIHYRGVVLSCAHQRLAVLCAGMGRIADAERHLELLESWWDRPDDVARRMLDQARSAVRFARVAAREAAPASAR